MLKFVRIVDDNGFFVRDEFVDELTEFTIEMPCPCGFYKPRWDGEKWVEGLPEDEIHTRKNQVECQHRIRELETLLAERYQAHGRLLATSADQSEIDEVKDEIALILSELGGLYNATTTQTMPDLWA